ncbi:TPA: hypothetical protein EYP38_05710 [Candidatus Micrarchaeota archaeon]|nr:hypothetical protein [Candidatus Micrarchaeota archaeon]
MNTKRMTIAVMASILFGIFCAWGSTMVQIPGMVVTLPLLATIFYNRVLIGFMVGLAEHVSMLKDRLPNAALRGALIGAIVSIGVMLPGGLEAAALLVFGALYGAIVDVVATKYGG